MYNRKSDSVFDSFVSGAVIAAGSALAIIAISSVVALVTALPVMLLWNIFIPSTFSLPSIGFVQAFGLSLVGHYLVRSTSSSYFK